MTYTVSQNYTDMMIGEHGIQTFKVVVVVLLLFFVVIWCFLSPQVHISYYFKNKQYVRIYLNITLHDFKKSNKNLNMIDKPYIRWFDVPRDFGVWLHIE